MGYLMATTNKELLDKLTKIEGRISNGKIKSIYDDVKDIKEILLDPEDGVIVRVNKNTERLNERDKHMGKWMRDVDDFHQMKRWKGNVTKALWGLYAAVIGWIVKNLFW